MSYGAAAHVTEEAVTLSPIARAQSEVLTNVLELYVHDFSEHVSVPLKPSGRFELPLEESWWTCVDHHPFLIYSAGKLAGFALVRRGSRVSGDADAMDVAEFFVLRGLRRRRVGLAAAQALFARFPGRWEIRVRQSNRAAQSFWARAASSGLGHVAAPVAFSSQGVDWQLLKLDSTTAPSR
jgi:predicted acetyltransferase